MLQVSNLLYLIFNLACRGAQSKGQLIAFRFLRGLGGSAPLAVSVLVRRQSRLANVTDRWRRLGLYLACRLTRPRHKHLQPGSAARPRHWSSDRGNHRAEHELALDLLVQLMVDGLIQISGLFFLQETYASTLLNSKKQRLLKETGNDQLYTEYDHPDKTMLKVIGTALSRPFKLLC